MKFTNRKNGMTLSIEVDECPESPREWDCLSTMYTWQSRYISPDDNNFRDIQEFIASILGNSIEEKIYDTHNNASDYIDDVIKRLDKKGIIARPIYCYDHSATAYSTTPFGCVWDSGMVGIIFVKKEKIYQEYNIKKITKKIMNEVVERFESECEIYTEWANGEVYGFVLKNSDGETLNSCWGFYNCGDLEEQLKDYASDVVDEFNELEWGFKDSK